MKALQILTISSMILFNSTSFAKTPRSVRHMQSAMMQKGFVLKERKALAPQCSDFSGKWQGSCVDQGGRVENEIVTIEQEKCFGITIDGFPFYINASTSYSWSQNPESEIGFMGSMATTTAYDWNDSQTKLKGLTSHSMFNGSRAGIATHSIWMSGDQLRITDEYATPFVDIDGPSTWKRNLYDCTYDRVSSGQ